MVILPVVNVYTGKVHNFKWRLNISDPGFEDFLARVNKYRECMYGKGWVQGDPIKLYKLPPHHYVNPRPGNAKMAEAIVNFELKLARFRNGQQVIVGRYFSFHNPVDIHEVWAECYDKARRMDVNGRNGDLSKEFSLTESAGELVGIPEFYVPEFSLKQLGSWNTHLDR